MSYHKAAGETKPYCCTLKGVPNTLAALIDDTFCSHIRTPLHAPSTPTHLIPPRFVALTFSLKLCVRLMPDTWEAITRRKKLEQQKQKLARVLAALALLPLLYQTRTEIGRNPHFRTKTI